MKLVPVRVPRSPDGLVLVLHGGARRGPERVMVSPAQLSVVRMVPTAWAAARAGRGRLAVYRVLNSWRGWDDQQTPVADVVAAMGQAQAEHGDLPVGLIGHSLGGRAALLAGQRPGVVSVVALNPWVYPTDDADLTGRRVLVLHGTEDRIADPQRAEVVADRLSRRTHVEVVPVEGGKHAMLRHGREFDRRAADFTAAALLERV